MIIIFIAYDFNIVELPNKLAALQDERRWPKGYIIKSPGDTSGRSLGDIWLHIVKPGIEECNRLLAFVDLPNANVGFEIGYALGKGKPIGLAISTEPRHAWLRRPPLNGLLTATLETVPEIRTAISNSDSWKNLISIPKVGLDVLMLCPTREGAHFLEQIPDEWDWHYLPSDGWGLHSSIDKDREGLADKLEGVGLVVWVITHAKRDPTERDGIENAALSVVAGYAYALPEVQVRVLWASGAREVADITTTGRRFKDLAGFKDQLSRVKSEWDRKIKTPKSPISELLSLLPQSPESLTSRHQLPRTQLPIHPPLKSRLPENQPLEPQQSQASPSRLSWLLGAGIIGVIFVAIWANSSFFPPRDSTEVDNATDSTTINPLIPPANSESPKQAPFPGYGSPKRKKTGLLGAKNDPNDGVLMNRLGEQYLYGNDSIEVNDSLAIEWFIKAINADNAKAMVNLGSMYKSGLGGLKKDDVKAMFWYRKAANSGNSQGQVELGEMYANGEGGLIQNDTTAVFWYRKAATQGNSDGQAYLGAMYENGQGGLAKNDTTAVILYQKSAIQKNAEGQSYLGDMYEHGKGGLRTDKTKAISLYRQAALQGEEFAKGALHRLGVSDSE